MVVFQNQGKPTCIPAGGLHATSHSITSRCDLAWDGVDHGAPEKRHEAMWRHPPRDEYRSCLVSQREAARLGVTGKYRLQFLGRSNRAWSKPSSSTQTSSQGASMPRSGMPPRPNGRPAAAALRLVDLDGQEVYGADQGRSKPCRLEQAILTKRRSRLDHRKTFDPCSCDKRSRTGAAICDLLSPSQRCNRGSSVSASKPNVRQSKTTSPPILV